MKRTAAETEGQQQKPAQSQDPPLLIAKEDPWNICLSTRVLSSFLGHVDHCRLSVCARKFLDFRKQVWGAKCSPQTMPALLQHMSTGLLDQVTTLDLSVSIHFMPKPRRRKTFLDLLVAALSRVPKLQHMKYFGGDQEVFKAVMSKGLTPAMKASLKTLNLSAIPREGLNDSTFAGLANLERLDVDRVHPGLIASLCKHNFPRLHTISMLGGDIRQIGQTDPLAEALLDGKMPNIKSLRLAFVKIGPRFIDAVVQLMPRLDHVSLDFANCTTADKKRLRLAAAGHNVRLSL
jgi:hypothetical protein